MLSFALSLLCAFAVLGGCRAQVTDGSTHISGLTSASGLSLTSELSPPTNGFSLSTEHATGLTSTNGHASTNGLSAGQSSGLSAADQVHQEFSSALDIVNANMAEGVKSLMRPLMSFWVETAPNLGHLYWLIQGSPVRREVVDVAKHAWAQGSVKMAQLMGRGFAGGSQVAKGAMEGVGNFLNEANGVVNEMASAAIQMADDMMQMAITLEMNKLEMLMATMEVTGKAIQDAGPRAKELADALKVNLKAAEEKIKASLKEAKEMLEKVISDGTKVLENGRLQFETLAKEHFYNMVKNYKELLEKVRMRFEALNDKIKVIEDKTNSSVNISLDVDLTSNVDSGIEKTKVMSTGASGKF